MIKTLPLRNSFKILSILIFLSFVFFFFGAAHSFAFSTFYFYPQRKTIEIGSNEQIQLRLNTDGRLINAISAYIQYPQKLVDIQLNELSNAFPIVAEREFTDGFIRISEGSIDPVKGDVVIATLTLKAINAGSAPVTFTEGSVAATYDDNTNDLSLSRSIGGFYSIVPQQLPESSDTFIIIPFHFLPWR